MSQSDNEEIKRLELPLDGVAASKAMKNVSVLTRCYKIGITGQENSDYRIGDGLVHNTMASYFHVAKFYGNNIGVLESKFKVKHWKSMLFESEVINGELVGHSMGEFVDEDKLPFDEAVKWVETAIADPQFASDGQAHISPHFSATSTGTGTVSYPSHLIVYGINLGYLTAQEVAGRCESLLKLDGFCLVERGDLYLFSKLKFCEADTEEQLKYVGSHDSRESDIRRQLLELLVEKIGNMPEKVKDEELEEMEDGLKNEGYDEEKTDKATRRGMLAWLHFDKFSF
jgi:hypothetical protein